MFARVSRIQARPDQIDAGIRQFDTATQVIQGLPGWQGGYILADRENGRIVTITLWRSRDDLAASAAAASKIRDQAGADAGAAAAPTVEVYEVVRQP